MKDKILIVWLLVVVALGLAFSHFLTSAVYALGRAVVFSLAFLPCLAKLATALGSAHLLR